MQQKNWKPIPIICKVGRRESFALYRKVAHRFGVADELMINRQQPRHEIVQIVSAAERFSRQHEQRLDQLFRCPSPLNPGHHFVDANDLLAHFEMGEVVVGNVDRRAHDRRLPYLWLAL